MDLHTYLPDQDGVCLICEQLEAAEVHRRVQVPSTGNGSSNGRKSSTSAPVGRLGIASKGVLFNSGNGVGSSDAKNIAVFERYMAADHAYTWGNSSKVGVCSELYFRDNNEHHASNMRQESGTHKWPVDRRRHALGHAVPLIMSRIPKKTIVRTAASENHGLVLSQSGQLHAIHKCDETEQKCVARLRLRHQIVLVSC